MVKQNLQDYKKRLKKQTPKQEVEQSRDLGLKEETPPGVLKKEKILD